MIMGPASVFAFVIGYAIGNRFAHSSHSIGSLLVHCSATFASAFVAAASAHIFDPTVHLYTAMVVAFSASGIGMLIGVVAGSLRGDGG
jgi:hypothetical protein